jgi:hypothetical protein
MATAMIADNSFTRISPRQLQHYLLRTTYKPQTWLTFAGTTNILESRDNVQTVNHLEHNRDFSFGTSASPSDGWSLDLNYAYDSVYSNTLECYTASPALPSAGTAPPVCVAAGTPLLSTGYYNQPTQYGVIGFMLAPVKRLHVNAGYRMSAVNGNSDFINARQVPGTLQSQYQTPMLISPSISHQAGPGRRTTTTTASAKERRSDPLFPAASAGMSTLSRFVMLSSFPEQALFLPVLHQ